MVSGYVKGNHIPFNLFLVTSGIYSMLWTFGIVHGMKCARSGYIWPFKASYFSNIQALPHSSMFDIKTTAKFSI